MKKSPKKMSPEARKKISAGMKKRYAEMNAAVEQALDQRGMFIAAEFGYLAHEKGKSIHQMMIDLRALLNGVKH